MTFREKMMWLDQSARLSVAMKDSRMKQISPLPLPASESCVEKTCRR
jgi:hypothetical protein